MPEAPRPDRGCCSLFPELAVINSQAKERTGYRILHLSQNTAPPVSTPSASTVRRVILIPSWPRHMHPSSCVVRPFAGPGFPQSKGSDRFPYRGCIRPFLTGLKAEIFPVVKINCLQLNSLSC